MQYTDDRHHLRVAFDTKQCTIPADERARMESLLGPVGEAVEDFPQAELNVAIIFHPRSQAYHVEFKLRLPGKSLFTGDSDPYLDSAFQRCVRKLLRRIDAYKENPDRRAQEVAEHETALDRDIVAPEGPDAGPLARPVEEGDYRAFRNALVRYEDWLRLRVGRWLQRFPEAEARLGHGLTIGDLVEEVYLNAFEGYADRPTAISFSEWLDRLVDPSLKALLRHPDEESEAARFARTVRETPLS